MEQSNYQSSHADGTINFRQVLFLFWESKLTISIITIVTMAIAICFTVVRPHTYSANALLQIEKSNSNSSGMLMQSLSFNAPDNTAATHIALIRSRYILEPVIEALNLDKKVTPLNDSIWQRVTNYFKNNNIKISQLKVQSTLYPLTLLIRDAKHYELRDKYHRVIASGAFNEVIKNNTLKILLENPSELKSGRFEIKKYYKDEIIRNILQRLKIEEVTDGSFSAHTGILQIIFQDNDPKRLVDFLNTLIDVVVSKDFSKKSTESAKTLSFLKLQLPKALKALDEAEQKLTNYRIKHGKLDIKIETQQLLKQTLETQDQISKLEVQYSNALQRYTSEHPFIISLKHTIAQLKIKKQVFEDKIRRLPAEDKTAIDLFREVKVRNSIYILLLNKIQEFTVISARTMSEVSILNHADFPEVPLSKRLPLVFLASLLLGLIASSLFVIARRAFHHKVNDPLWLEKYLNLSNLAIIPYSKQQVSNTNMRNRNGSKKQDLLAERYSRDLAVEALRSLRTSFQIMTMEAQNNIACIMGVSQSIGKSFVSANLSYLIADVGSRVLLIDGDLRKGRLNEYFNFKKSPGLSELISAKITKEEAIHQYSKSLHFLACGAYPENPSELLHSPRFKEILNEFSSHYDLIIIDTAPVLAVTDSLLLGKLSSINLLVVGGNRHEPEEIMLAVKQFEQANIKILGTIYNTLQENTTMYGNYRYKYSAYGTEKHDAVA